MRKEDRTFWADFKRLLLRGLAILLPSVLTIWIVVQLYLFVDKQVASPINAGIRAGVVWVMPRLPDRYQPRWFKVTERELAEFRATLHQQGTSESRALLRRNDTDLRNEIRRQEFARFWESQWYLRFLGLIVAIVLFYLAGVIFGGLFGRAMYQQLERFITRIPVIKQVYPHVKQVVDLILGEKQMAFSKVVLFEYPRKGIWTIGFVTNSGMKAVAGAAGEDAVTIFIPSTPTPFTGFTITVPRVETIDINLSVDEAIRFVLTGGVLIPERQRVEAADTIVPGKLSSGPAESREGT